MSYKKKDKQKDDEWRKKHFKGANVGPGGYQAHYVNNVIKKYEKIAGKAGGKAAAPAPAPAPAPQPVQQPVSSTGRAPMTLTRRGKPVAPPAAAAPARDASPKRPMKKRYVTHHPKADSCTVTVRSYTRKKPSCKKE